MTFLFVYLNNAVRKFRYFVTIISQFVFYMMLQLSLNLSPSDKKHTIEKNSNFLFFEKRHKNEKIFAVWIKTANYKFSRFQHFERFPTNKLNKVDTKCSNFKSRPKFMPPVLHFHLHFHLALESALRAFSNETSAQAGSGLQFI